MAGPLTQLWHTNSGTITFETAGPLAFFFCQNDYMLLFSSDNLIKNKPLKCRPCNTVMAH